LKEFLNSCEVVGKKLDFLKYPALEVTVLLKDEELT